MRKNLNAETCCAAILARFLEIGLEVGPTNPQMEEFIKTFVDEIINAIERDLTKE